MEQTTRHISPLQFALLETTAFLGLGIFEFPRLLVLKAGNDAAWAFLGDVAAAFWGVAMLLKVAALAPDETLIAFARPLLPGWLYWPFAVGDDLLHLGLPVIALAQFTFLLTTFFLPHTPVFGVEAALAGMAVYIAWWELPALARTAQTVYLPIIALTIVLSLLLIPRMTDAYAIVPSTHLRLGPTALAAYQNLYIFAGFEVVPLLWPYVRDSQRPLARRYTYLAMGLAATFYVMLFMVTLGTEDPWFLTHLEWPAVSALRLINVSGLIINKLGLLVVVLWGVATLFFVSLRIWAITHGVLPVLRLESMAWYRRISVGVAGAVLALCRLFPNIMAVDAATRRLVPVLLLFVYIYPLVFFVAARLRWGGGGALAAAVHEQETPGARTGNRRRDPSTGPRP